MIGIICVLFKPSFENIEAITERLADTENVIWILVDNTPFQYINYEFQSTNRIKYIPLSDNKGMATAQNMGIKEAKNIGCTHLIFFDQDSAWPSVYIKNIYTEYNTIKNIDDKIGILGPIIVNKYTNTSYKTELKNDILKFAKVTSVISSGSIIEISTIDRVGGMDDALFIDFIDNEWCWRAKSKGYNIYMSANVELPHSVGNGVRTFFGISVIISAPVRYYYKYRNTILLLSRSYVPTGWKIKSVVRRLFELLYVPIISNDGRSVLRNAFKGIKDGFHIS